MKYREIQPQPSLSRYIECFWVLTGESEPLAQKPHPILPDGCMELILNFSDPFERHRIGSTPQRQPRLILAGQLDQPVHIQPTGRVAVLGARFHPGGAWPLLRVPMEDLTNRILALEEVSSKLARDVESNGNGAQMENARVRALEALLLQRFKSAVKSDRPVEAAVQMILAGHGCVSVTSVARQVGLSLRQLERRFAQTVGLDPKLFSEIIRFQCVFTAVEHGPAGRWVDVAIECGYYDQSHFNKDFKRFSGRPPSVFFSQEHVLAHHFTRKNRASNFYKTGESSSRHNCSRT